MRCAILVAAVASVLAGGGRPVAAKMFGTTASGGVNWYTLVEIDLSTGATAPIGDPLEFWTSLDMGPDGTTLYAVDKRLFTINSADGTYVDVGPLSYGGTSEIATSAMSISPTGDIYVISSRTEDPSGKERLYTVDPSSGAMTLKGELDQTKPINAMEFAPDGTLYAAFGDLYILNPNNGTILQTIGVLGDPYLDGLDIDEHGQMIGLNDFHDKLYTIDPAGTPGALATHLVDVPDDEVYSIASGPALDIPEPSTLTLLSLAAGLIGLAFCDRWRGIRN